MRTLNIVNKLKSVSRNPSLLLFYICGKFKYFPTGLIANRFMVDLPIYCINLNNSTTRRSFMKKQVDKAGFNNFQFSEGIDGASLDLYQSIEDGSYNDELAKKYHQRSLHSNEIALSLSHGLIYKKIVRKSQQIALILEDDALFVTKRINNINTTIFPPDWDLIFLSSFLSSTPPKGHIIRNLYTTESWEGSSAAYLISLKGASKLEKVYKPVIHAADGFIGRNMNYRQKHHFKQQGARAKINTYLIFPDSILNGSSVGFWRPTIPFMDHLMKK